MDTTALVIPHLLSRVDYVLIDVGAGISFQCFKERQHKETLLSPRALELTFGSGAKTGLLKFWSGAQVALFTFWSCCLILCRRLGAKPCARRDLART